LDDAADIAAAAGGEEGEEFSHRLEKVVQLSGLGDPVYVEAVVLHRAYDVVMDISVTNRTAETLTNVALELSTAGDMKLVDRPGTLTIGPGDTAPAHATVKVSSLEMGHIFGTLSYNSSSSAEKHLVNLRDLAVDVMDYIHPRYIESASFRKMWAMFEWENRVTINTQMTEPKEFINHIAAHTNTRILTPIEEFPDNMDFLAANFYAKSSFGEDALMNISIEKRAASLHGHVRIRAKTQGVALALGDRINSAQRAVVGAAPTASEDVA
jgi:coatomer subunit beta